VPEESDLLRLFYFDEAYLTPIVGRRRWLRSNRADVFTLGELLEGYFWLSLGVEIGYYSEDSAQLLAAARFVELLSQFKELFREYGYLFAPAFEARIQTMLSLKRVLQPAVDYTFVRPLQFHPWFQRALGLEIESLQDNDLTTFFAAFALLAPPEIGALLSNESLIVNTDFFGRLHRRGLIEGFGTSLNHLESFALLDAEIRNLPDLDPEDSFAFRSRIKQLTRWRLNLHNPNVVGYYPLIGNLFVDTNLGGSGLSIDSFRAALATLLNEWGLTHERTQTA
jgi:hypothetical protein